MTPDYTDTTSPSADLSVTKSDGVESVVAGDGVTHTYTITVTNAGPSERHGRQPGRHLPIGLQPGRRHAEPGDVHRRASVHLRPRDDPRRWQRHGHRGVHGAGLDHDSPQVNTASVTSAVPDPDTANDTATNLDIVTANADVADLKTVCPTPSSPARA